MEISLVNNANFLLSIINGMIIRMYQQVLFENSIAISTHKTSSNTDWRINNLLSSLRQLKSNLLNGKFGLLLLLWSKILTWFNRPYQNQSEGYLDAPGQKRLCTLYNNKMQSTKKMQLIKFPTPLNNFYDMNQLNF